MNWLYDPLLWAALAQIIAMDRLPWLVPAGGALIGWIAGGMVVADLALQPFFPLDEWVHWIASVGSAAAVLLAGLWLARRERSTALN
ncbi:MAG: hypothetical protein CFE47_02260 [Pseudomonas sp. PGPPP1]|uniref:hypothetical protein n=1 Tax=Pseudomonas sp. PGPPP1 TaxID=2015553 RepID=UPI000BDBDCD8|nr:hypothetical protein [Pseudomonas sp. PGPPP1]OYU09195.1 MAG: hypothetical protein CFE47_02260 [Pseudomonas sp. PGPPP1]